MVVPDSWHDDRVFWERLVDPVILKPSLSNGQVITFLVEGARENCLFGATPNDIVKTLSHMPENDLEGIEVIVLRQPTRKQQRLAPVWGRFMYFANLGSDLSGTGICLEAQDISRPIRWPISLTPEGEREFHRLEEDGHVIEKDRRHYLIHVSPESLRCTVLYRTLLHEVGHCVDWYRSVLDPLAGLPEDGPEAQRLERAFWNRTSSMKEDFAHRYASEQGGRLRGRLHIPFDCLDSPATLRKQGLDPAWFACVSDASD